LISIGEDTPKLTTAMPGDEFHRWPFFHLRRGAESLGRLGRDLWVVGRLESDETRCPVKCMMTWGWVKTYEITLWLFNIAMV
jgi:hypothetical protein